MREREAHCPEAAHGVAENRGRANVQRVQDFTGEAARDGKHVDIAIIERISETMPRPIHCEHVITLRESRHERRPLKRFTQTPMKQKQRRAFSSFDDLRCAPRPTDAQDAMSGNYTVEISGLARFDLV